MNKFSFYLTIFSLFISFVFSELNTLRGGSKDKNEKSSLIETNFEINRDIFEKEVNLTNNESILSGILINDTKKNSTESRILTEVQKEQDGDDAGNSSDTDTSNCGSSFVVWFNKGIAITTVECSKYSVIYSGKQGNGDSEPKYIQGPVTTVVIESESSIKVNNLELSTISTKPETPTPNGKKLILKARILEDSVNEDSEIIRVYSFPIKTKIFDLYLPKQTSADNRDKYSLGHGDNVFYTSKENGAKYTLKENGDLVDSDNKVILKGDSSSSAFKTIYSIPSLFAVLISLLLL